MAAVASGDPKLAEALVGAGGDVNARAVGLPGDFNNNGVVDAADFTVWRDNLGLSVALPNDTTPGEVTWADYDLWVSNFGATAAST